MPLPLVAGEVGGDKHKASALLVGRHPVVGAGGGVQRLNTCRSHRLSGRACTEAGHFLEWRGRSNPRRLGRAPDLSLLSLCDVLRGPGIPLQQTLQIIVVLVSRGRCLRCVQLSKHLVDFRLQGLRSLHDLILVGELVETGVVDGEVDDLVGDELESVDENTLGESA